MNLEKIKSANTKYIGKNIIYKEKIKSTEELSQLETDILLEQRFNKFRTIGQKYIKLEESNI